MNILVINGSPKGTGSNTYRLTSAFLDGMKQGIQDIQTKELSLSRMNIKPCLGCFSCWNRTPGQCCIQDDMQQIIQDLLWAGMAFIRQRETMTAYIVFSIISAGGEIIQLFFAVRANCFVFRNCLHARMSTFRM